MKSDELKKRTKAFALRIYTLVNALPDTVAGRTVAVQLFKAGTSVAANYRATCRGRSKAEFKSKLHIVLEEIDNASNEKTTQLRSLIEQFQTTILVWEPTMKKLTDAYFANKVLPLKAYRDAQHIAFSTVNELDFVISWNLRHIANVHRQKKVNAINMLNGYTKPLQLITPMEVSYNAEN